MKQRKGNTHDVNRKQTVKISCYRLPEDYGKTHMAVRVKINVSGIPIWRSGVKIWIYGSKCTPEKLIGKKKNIGHTIVTRSQRSEVFSKCVA